jgi:hypothetical protein
LLIVSGNIRQACPIHLSCRVGRLEPLELLLSAGIPGGSGDVFDSKGFTALHNVALSDNRFGELSLIVSLLCLSFPESLKIYDRTKDGNLPIHSAIAKDNLVVLESMVSAVTSLREEHLASNSLNRRKSSSRSSRGEKEEKEKEKLFDIFSYFTANGKNLFQIAKEHNSILCENYLYSLVKAQKKVNATTSNSKKSSSYSAVDSSVSQERIMKIWEKFFENAFKNAGITDEDVMDDANEDNDYYSHSAVSASSYKDDKPKTKKSTDGAIPEGKERFAIFDESAISYVPSSSSKKQSTLAPIYPYSTAAADEVKEFDDFQDSQMIIDNWFDWIVCYDSEYAQECGASSTFPSTSYDYYYVLNIKTKERKWLNEYYSDLINMIRFTSSEHERKKKISEKRKKPDSARVQYLFLYEDSVSIVKWPFPISLKECVTYGWMTYDDSYENVCYWMNIVSYIIEVYLPLAAKNDNRAKVGDERREKKEDMSESSGPSGEEGEKQEDFAKSGLQLSVEYPLWYEASQFCCYSWMMVICSESAEFQEESASSACYYLNSLTTHTQWNPPNNWDYLVSTLWSGWILCCLEEKQEETFW